MLEDILHDVELRYKDLESNPEAQLGELIHEAAFGETSSLGASRFAVNAHNIDVASVLAYRAAHFTAPNLVVSASGLSHDHLKALVERNASKLATGSKTAFAPSPFNGGEVRVRKDLHGETFVAVGFPVPAGAAANAYAVLQQYLASHLANHKCHASAELHAYSTGGLLAVTAHGSSAAVVASNL